MGNEQTKAPREGSKDMEQTKPAPHHAPDGPKKIEDLYTLGKELGRGHFARVVVGHDKRNGRKVAIKIIQKKEFAKNQETVKEEIKILMRVGNHPHVVNLIDTFEDETFNYLIMEFCAGGDLFGNIVEEGQFNDQLAVRYCRQLAQSIQYIHRCGVTHRDLKPENILMTSRDLKTASLKIADFGLSKVVREPTAQMQTVCGTWAYCAPEVINRQPYGPAVDNWSLGVLMFILLSGYHPFDMYGDLPEPRLLRNIKGCHYDFEDEAWDHVSPLAKELIRKLLVVDPDERMSLDDFLKSEWILGEDKDKQVKDLSHVSQRIGSQLTPRHKFRALVMAKLAGQKFKNSIQHRKPIDEIVLHDTMKGIEEEHGVSSPSKEHDHPDHYKWVADPLHPMEDSG